MALSTPGKKRKAASKRASRKSAPQLWHYYSYSQMYSAFIAEFGMPGSVLYPSCGFDASPADSFSNVTFLDNESFSKGCIDALANAGYNAIKSDINDYRPSEDYGLVILLKPRITSDIILPFLKTGGFVIADDYHLNASQMIRLPSDFELSAGIYPAKGSSSIIERSASILLERYSSPELFMNENPELVRLFYAGNIISQAAKLGLKLSKNNPYPENFRKLESFMEKEGCREKIELPYRNPPELYVFKKK